MSVQRSFVSQNFRVFSSITTVVACVVVWLASMTIKQQGIRNDSNLQNHYSKNNSSQTNKTDRSSLGSSTSRNGDWVWRAWPDRSLIRVVGRIRACAEDVGGRVTGDDWRRTGDVGRCRRRVDNNGAVAAVSREHLRIRARDGQSTSAGASSSVAGVLVTVHGSGDGGRLRDRNSTGAVC